MKGNQGGDCCRLAHEFSSKLESCVPAAASNSRGEAQSSCEGHAGVELGQEHHTLTHTFSPSPEPASSCYSLRWQR